MRIGAQTSVTRCASFTEPAQRRREPQATPVDQFTAARTERAQEVPPELLAALEEVLEGALVELLGALLAQESENAGAASPTTPGPTGAPLDVAREPIPIDRTAFMRRYGFEVVPNASHENHFQCEFRRRDGAPLSSDDRALIGEWRKNQGRAESRPLANPTLVALARQLAQAEGVEATTQNLGGFIDRAKAQDEAERARLAAQSGAPRFVIGPSTGPAPAGPPPPTYPPAPATREAMERAVQVTAEERAADPEGAAAYEAFRQTSAWSTEAARTAGHRFMRSKQERLGVMFGPQNTPI